MKTAKIITRLLVLGIAVYLFSSASTVYAAGSAQWDKNGSLVYNGKTYNQEVVEGAGTGSQVVYFTPKADYAANPGCPVHQIRFASGVDVSSAKTATYEEMEPKLCIAPVKTANISITNKRPGGKDTGSDPVLTALNQASKDQNSGQKPLSDDNYCATQDGRASDPALCGTPCKDADSCSLTAKYIDPIINKFLVPLAVIAVIIGIIWGAITYITSGGDPQKVALGKSRIAKALLGLLAFIFLYAILNWLIPGGLTSSPPPPTTPSNPGAQM